jgi:hypothetical protein
MHVPNTGSVVQATSRPHTPTSVRTPTPCPQTRHTLTLTFSPLMHAIPLFHVAVNDWELWSAHCTRRSHFKYTSLQLPLLHPLRCPRYSLTHAHTQHPPPQVAVSDSTYRGVHIVHNGPALSSRTPLNFTIQSDTLSLLLVCVSVWERV